MSTLKLFHFNHNELYIYLFIIFIYFNKSTQPHKRIIFLLVSNCCCRTMTRINLCLIGHNKKLRTDTLDKLFKITACQVGSTYTASEKHIAHKNRIRCFTVKYNTTGRMTRNMKNPQSLISE